MNNIGAHTIYNSEASAHLNLWMFETIRPYIKGRTLEMSSGCGLISALFIQHEFPIHLNHVDADSCGRLYQKFKGYPDLRNVHKIDFHNPNFEQVYSKYAGAFDTLVSLDVIGRSTMDQAAISNAKILLRRRGHLMVLALSDTMLFDNIEPDWEYLKRNNRHSIKKFLNNEFDILKTRYLNLWETSDTIKYGPNILSVLVVGRKQ